MGAVRSNASRFAGSAVWIPAPRRPWPSVGVVIVTGDRPNLVRRALASVDGQDYPGSLRTVVVFDEAQPDWTLARSGERPVLVLENWRTPGRAGARNTGILAVGDCELVAICDDRDVWSPKKLTAQVAALRCRPDSVLSTCGVEVEYGNTRLALQVGRDRMGVADLCTADRRFLHASGFLAVQRSVATDQARGGIGLLCENAPAEGEELDLLLRAAKRGPIAHVDQPLVRVLWRPTDLGPGACLARARALRWLLSRHPELVDDPDRHARISAAIACWYAGAGDLARARRFTAVALRRRKWSGHAHLALAASSGILGRRLLRVALRRTVSPAS